MNQHLELIGKRVSVYRNLRNKKFSVMIKGKVVNHLEEISLKNVEFRVRKGGRERVLREGKKNVHAFVVGEVLSFAANRKLSNFVTYNPYVTESFVMVDNKSEIHDATEASLWMENGKAKIGT